MHNLRCLLDDTELFLTTLVAYHPDVQMPAILTIGDPADEKPSMIFLEDFLREIGDVPKDVLEAIDPTVPHSAAVATLIAAERPAFAALIFESWASLQETGGGPLIQASQDPERMDTITVAGIDAEGAGEVRTYVRTSSVIERPHLELRFKLPLSEMGGSYAEALRLGMALSKAKDPFAALREMDADSMAGG